MAKPVSHVVTRPGRRQGDADVTIPVAEELATVPGIPLKEEDLSFYSRVYPQETQNIEKAADREWVWTVYSDEMANYRRYHDEVSKPLIDAAAVSGELEPTGTPDPELNVTEAIRSKARELGFNEVGFTKHDKRFTYTRKKRWIQVPARDLSGSGTGLRADAIDPQHGRGIRPLRHLRDGRRLPPGPGRLYPLVGLSRPGAQPQ